MKLSRLEIKNEKQEHEILRLGIRFNEQEENINHLKDENIKIRDILNKIEMSNELPSPLEESSFNPYPNQSLLPGTSLTTSSSTAASLENENTLTSQHQSPRVKRPARLLPAYLFRWV